jgi:hypothetical protein
MNAPRSIPDMRPYFRGRIARHVNGMFAGHGANFPQGVRGVRGDVTDAVIRVELWDGRTLVFSGGRFATRKVNLCYAPLMPTFVACEAAAMNATAQP